MSKDLVKTEINVIDNKIGIMRIGDVDYISLTDLARYADAEEPRLPIRDWMRNKEVISYLGLWESMNNKNFKGGEFATFKNEAGSNKFKMSPQKWVKETNAIGIVSKSGRYDGGTFAHPDIAFEFASWLSPEFKLYLIKEFERLNTLENSNREWDVKRILTKNNYIIHTEAIKNYILPDNDYYKNKEWIKYAEEADILNVAIFNTTAKKWRELNPNLARNSNIRDYATINELTVLSNLESHNAELIKEGKEKEEGFEILSEIAKYQLGILNNAEKIKLLGDKKAEK